MLHQPITEDPDVATAVADFRDTVVEIRTRSMRWFGLAEGSTARAAEQDAIDDLVERIATRAGKLGLTVDQLLAFINADLKTRGSRNPAVPYGPYQDHLIEENNRAHAAVRTIKREIGRLEKLLVGAEAEREAADRACGGIYAGWAVRGQR